MRHNVLIYGGTLHGDRSQIARNAVSGQFPSARRSDQMPACRATHREYNTHVNIARRDSRRRPRGCTGSHVLWRYRKALPNTSSPLLYQGVIYLVRDGVFTSLNPENG